LGVNKQPKATVALMFKHMHMLTIWIWNEFEEWLFVGYDSLATQYLVVVICAEVNWKKCQPDNASGVHRKSNIFGFIKVFWYFSGLESVPGAEDNEYHIVNQRHDERES
jgi:hypothetical protein